MTTSYQNQIVKQQIIIINMSQQLQIMFYIKQPGQKIEQNKKTEEVQWRKLKQYIKQYYKQKNATEIMQGPLFYQVTYSLNSLKIQKKDRVKVCISIKKDFPIFVIYSFQICNQSEEKQILSENQQQIVEILNKLNLRFTQTQKIFLQKDQGVIQIKHLLMSSIEQQYTCQVQFTNILNRMQQNVVTVIQQIMNYLKGVIDNLKLISMTNTLRKIIDKQIGSRKKSSKLKQLKVNINAQTMQFTTLFKNSSKCMVNINRAQKYLGKLCESSKVSCQQAIMQTIKVNRSVEQQAWRQRRTNYSKLKQVLMNFDVIKTSSNYESHNLIKSSLSMAEQIPDRRQELLIEKQPRQQSMNAKNSFNNQFEILKILRNFCCDSIANYYTEGQDQHYATKQILYMPFYQRKLDFSSTSLKRGLLTVLMISLGLSFLSSKKILHRDLKPDNILINTQAGSTYPKIIDYGSSCPARSRNYNIKIPDALQTTIYYNLLYHQLPKGLCQILGVEEYQRNQNFDIYAFGKILEHLLNSEGLLRSTKKFTLIIENLIWVKNKCLELNPYDRINPSHLFGFLKHSWSIMKSHKEIL